MVFVRAGLVRAGAIADAAILQGFGSDDSPDQERRTRRFGLIWPAADGSQRVVMHRAGGGAAGCQKDRGHARWQVEPYSLDSPGFRSGTLMPRIRLAGARCKRFGQRSQILGGHADVIQQLVDVRGVLVQRLIQLGQRIAQAHHRMRGYRGGSPPGWSPRGTGCRWRGRWWSCRLSSSGASLALNSLREILHVGQAGGHFGPRIVEQAVQVIE